MKFYMCQIGIDLFEKIFLFKSVILKILPEHIESEMCIDQNIKIHGPMVRGSGVRAELYRFIPYIYILNMQ